MTRLRSKLVRRPSVVTVGVLFLLAACDEDRSSIGPSSPLAPERDATNGAPAIGDPPVAPFDGLTIYRGVMQGRGPVVDRVPELREHVRLDRFVTRPELVDAVVTVQDAIVDRMQTIDPAFFDRFGAEMTSGDHLRLRAALEDAGRATYDAIATWPEFRTIWKQLQTDPAGVRKLIERADAVTAAQGVDLRDGLTDGGSLGRLDALALAYSNGGSDPLVFPSLMVIVALALFVAVVHWVVAWINVVHQINFYTDVAVTTDIYITDGGDQKAFGGRLWMERVIDSMATRLVPRLP